MKIKFLIRESYSQENYYTDWFELESGKFGVVRPKPDHAIDDSTPQNLPIIVDDENFPINTDDQKHIFLKQLLDIPVFTEDQFKTFLQRPDWTQSQEIEFTDSEEVQTMSGETVLCCNGICTLYSRLKGIEISYTEGFHYYAENQDSFVASSEGLDEPLKITGQFFIIDEDGENITSYASDIINDYPWSDVLFDIDYSDVITDINSTADLDTNDEDDDFEQILLEVDNEPDLSFTGQLIVHTSSSEKNGRWVYLELYKTKSGKFVCYQVNKTCWQGERDFKKAFVVSSGLTEQTRNQQIIDFFGQGWLAKDLYYEAKINNSVNLD